MHQQHTFASADQPFLLAFLSQKHLRPKLLEQTKEVSLPLSPAAASPLSAGPAPPPPAHKWPHTRRDGGRAPNYTSLLTRGHGGEGNAGYRLLPVTQTRAAEVAGNLQTRSPSAGALGPPAARGGWASLVCPSPEKGRQEKPAGSPVVSCRLWVRRFGVWWENGRCTKPWGGSRGPCCSWGSGWWDAAQTLLSASVFCLKTLGKSWKSVFFCSIQRWHGLKLSARGKGFQPKSFYDL